MCQMVREGVGDCCECMAALCANIDCQKVHRIFCATLSICDNCGSLEWNIGTCAECAINYCGMQPCLDWHNEYHNEMFQEDSVDGFRDM
jgi:hypothetical protein